jgi:DoxX-like family
MENVLDSTISLGARGARTSLWIGRVLTGLSAAFLLFDAIGKLLVLRPVVEATGQLGFALGVIRPLGVVLALSTLLHLVPRTQFLGALLVTAYLGGATATMVHAGRSSFFAVAMGAIVWIGYTLRSPSIRALLFARPAR